MNHFGNNRLVALAGEIVSDIAANRASAVEIAERTIRIGKALAEAKASLRHGEWEPWLAANVSLSARSARRYMQVAESGLKTATVADLGLRGATEAIAASERRRNAEALAAWLLEKDVPAQFITWIESDPNSLAKVSDVLRRLSTPPPS